MPTRSSQHLRFDDVSVERKKLFEILLGVCNHFLVFLECTLLPLKNCVYQSNNFFNLNKKKPKRKTRKKIIILITFIIIINLILITRMNLFP